MRNPRILAATGALALLALAACSATSGDDDAGATAEPAAAGRAELDGKLSDEDSADRGPDGGSGGDEESAGRIEVQTRAVIATGTVVLVDKDLSRVRGEIDRLLGRYGGYVSDEATFNEPEGRTSESRLTLRVPSRHFATVMGGFAEIAKVQSTQTKAEDVTTEVIDVDSRVKTHETSLQRLRAFLSRTQEINAMIRLEGEIATREAQLESLRAQQKYLSDQTSLGTITVTLQTPEKSAEKKKDDNGFVAGLNDGWNALQDSFTVLATGLGAALPFLVVLTLVAAPVWLLVRKRSPGRVLVDEVGEAG